MPALGQRQGRYSPSPNDRDDPEEPTVIKTEPISLLARPQETGQHHKSTIFLCTCNEQLKSVSFKNTIYNGSIWI